ncbi:MAG: hemerythrin domain-containing protein [Ginsengibacter sp.]
MEKKPIKRNENIAKLSRDHHASLLFCFKIRQGIKKDVSTERMVRYVQYFEKQHFIPHFTEEEEILFAPLNDAKAQKAIDDHVHILRLAKEISFSGKENQQKELGKLADLVDDHVRYEERVLFPHLEEKLTDEQLEEIGKQISVEAIKDYYEDEFWK